MDFSVISDNFSYFMLGAWPNGPLGGAALTLLLSLLSGIISALLGLVLGIALVMIRGKVRWLLLGVLGFLRAIPVVMLIFWSYFLLPILFKVDVPALATVVCALSLIGGAYLAHSVYAGISSLPAGQWAAGKALGLGNWQVLRLIILPQAFRKMTPLLLQQSIILFQDTSLVYTVGLVDFLNAARSNGDIIGRSNEFLIFAGLVYFIISFSASLLVKRLQKRFAV